jgi:hypothetical protein
LVTGQHEIIENYKNAQNSFEAEREAHAAEIKRFEVNDSILIFFNIHFLLSAHFITIFLPATLQGNEGTITKRK